MINLIETSDIKEAISQDPQNVEHIIAETNIGICITNAEGNFVSVNDAYCQVYGFSKDELMGKSFTLVVPPENRETMKLLHDKFLKDKREIARNWKVQDKEGKELEISVDTAYADTIFGGGPHKITFIQVEE